MSSKSVQRKALEDYKAKLKKIREGAIVNMSETRKDAEERIERAKRDYLYCVEYYFPHYCTAKTPDFHIKLAKKIKRKKTYKGLVRWGRGLAKSVVCDVTVQFWLWLNEEVNYLVLVGNNADKAKILLSDLQAEFEANPRIINDFGEQKQNGSWEDGYFRTKSGFIAKAIGMGTSPRGLRVGAIRPDMIVCDDLDDKDLIKNHKRIDEIVTWILRDLIPTMDGPRRRCLVVNNRFAKKTIQSTIEEMMPAWDVDQVDAYDPVTKLPRWSQKYPATYYAEIEVEIGIIGAMAEYNNTPHSEGKIFKPEQIIFIKYPEYPALNHMQRIVFHWDVAYAGTPTSDFNAIKGWGLKDRKFYFVDGFVKQCKMREALVWLAQWILFEKPSTVYVSNQFESQFWNDEVQRTIQEVEDEYKIDFCFRKVDTPRSRKYDRILSMHPYYQNARIYYPESKKSNPYLQVGLDQLYGIEPGYNTKDDSPDADQQAIEELSKSARNSRAAPPIHGMRPRPKIDF